MHVSKLALGFAAFALIGTASAANRPSGYVTICSEGKTCSVDATTNVAFGRADKFFYKSISGSFACNEATFGGRIAGGVNECSVPSGSASSSSKSSAASSASSSVASSAASSAASSKSSVASSAASSATSSNASVPIPGWTGPVNVCEPGALVYNTTLDCGGKRIGLACAGSSETQPAVMTVINATLKNVVIPAGGGSDGIHCGWGSLGNGRGTNVQGGTCNLENVVWEAVCEDAASIGNGQKGTVMNIKGGSAANASDKVFQNNGINSTLNVDNFTTTGSIGKLSRACGDCTDNGGPRFFNINNVKMEKVSTVIGVNSNYGDKATLRNVQIKGYKVGSPKVCVTYVGVQKGNGSSSSIGEEWNSASCDVSKTDVTSY
ncbi:pectate lyase [Uliginosibacterium sp. TH139]|uniref:pectate lyase n=1 Tax=Uliginosibacterium sp. TH139 TaxID=2067453 RepID=UPI000C7D74E4|nr:pectate lyase [Uliginosibacterium sp. TH139]PLK48492.1 pectate lyase [Uliginosibacterium sp. TH139]